MQTNGIELLKAQHVELRVLLEVVAVESEASLRAAALARVTQLLTIHETAEEQILRPATQEHVPGGGRVAAERLAEESRARHALSRLVMLGVRAPEFDLHFSTFRADLLAHLDAEETEEFTAVRRGQEAGGIPQLGDALEAAEEAVPDSGRAGSTQT